MIEAGPKGRREKTQAAKGGETRGLATSGNREERAVRGECEARGEERRQAGHLGRRLRSDNWGSLADQRESDD